MAEFGRLISDESRVKILLLLAAGPATVSSIAAALNLAQPRVSAHLALLREARVILTEREGRQRVYRLADKSLVEVLLKILAQSALSTERRPPSVASARQVRKNTLLRQARSCYRHLAGVAGVELLQSLLDRTWLVEVGMEGVRRAYEVTELGRKRLAERGVDIDAARGLRQRFAFGCPDWTERRPHLGGALGAAILTALLAEGYLAREAGSRCLHVKRELPTWL